MVEGQTFRLGLDDASLAINPKQVVSVAGLEGVLAHNHPEPGMENDGGAVLDDPAAGGQLGLDILAGNGFGCGHLISPESIIALIL
jgi:hypothetical protein